MAGDEKNSKLTSTRRNALKLSVGATTVGTFGTTAVTAQAPERQKWALKTGAIDNSSPTVVDGTVYVGNRDTPGKLYAVDATDGTEQWTFAPDFGIITSPTVTAGTVYFTSWDSNLYALDAADGTQLWSFSSNYKIESSPTVVDGMVYFGGGDGRLYAVDAADGTEQWAFQTGGIVESSPTVLGGTVYIGVISSEEREIGRLYAVDTTDGTEQWAFDTNGEVRSSPTVVDGTVYVGDGSFRSGNVYAVDTETGTEQWIFQTGDRVYSSPTVADGTVYVGSNDTGLYAVDTADGTEQWVFKTDGAVISSPTVAGENVYVGSYDTKLYAVDAETGTEQWAFQTGDKISSSPTVVDGTVYVGDEAHKDGKLYALDANIDNSSEGSRVNLGTLGHHGEWADQASEDNTESTSVEIRNVDITPDEVDGTNEIHTLSFEVINLSADNGADDFTITLPDGIEVDSVSIQKSGNLSPNPPDAANPIEFRVDPSADDSTEVDFEVELKLSPSTG